MTSPVTALETALYAHLAAGTALTTALGGTAIYNRIAPLNTPLPYVVFQWQGGGDENITPSRMRNTVYTVKAISDDPDEAAALDGHIDTLLHNQSLTVTGWTNFWLAREDDIALGPPDPQGDVEWQQGGIYRIRIGQ